MSKLTLILGGARSGKSNYAENLAARSGRQVLYVATAEARDEEMLARIEAHQQVRPAAWHTLEAPRNVGSMLRSDRPYQPEVLLLDCLTLLVSNIVLSMDEEPESVILDAVEHEIQEILAAHQQLNLPLIIVSNEVGMVDIRSRRGSSGGSGTYDGEFSMCQSSLDESC